MDSMGFRVLQKHVVGVLLLILVITGCSTDVPQLEKDFVRDSGIREITTRTQESEATQQIAARELSGLQPLALGPNLYSNPSFESGLAGWTGCAAGAIDTTSLASNVSQGNQALELDANNCFFRSAEAVSGQEYVLSCDVKINAGSGWTGMGMLFEDSGFTTELSSAPTVVATSSDYARYETRAVAPANSAHVTMWMFSENDVVVDNCSLAVEDGQQPPPPPPNGDNLLENASFESLNGSSKPNDWSQGCGGSYASVAGRTSLGMQVTGGACVDQGLSSGDVSVLQGNNYTYSCYAKNDSGYASISIFLDGQPISKVIPASSSYQKISITTNAASSLSNGFVSIYSEGDLTIDDCSLAVGDTTPPPPPPPSEDNLLANGSFEAVNANNKPTAWSKGCAGSYASVAGRSGLGMNLTAGACVDQSLSSNDLAQVQDNTYTYSCYAKNSGGFAAISIFLNGQPISKVVPQGSNYQKVELAGTAPSSSNSGFVSLYSEGNLTVDDCSLVVGDVPPPPPPADTCAGSASYTLTFTNSWSAESHPVDAPSNPHFSDFVTANHNSDFVQWKTGTLASLGVKDVAEEGNPNAAIAEINNAIAQGDAEALYIGSNLGTAQVAVLVGQQRSFNVNVSSDYSQVSVISMIAPSPDWFIGLSGIEMCDNGQWIDSFTRSAFAYDSGTDDGANFTSSNQVSNPFVPVFRIDNSPVLVNGEIVPFGTFTLTKN